MLARVLSYRLWSVLHGGPTPGAWPALTRVLRRLPEASPRSTALAVTVHRPLRLRVFQPLALNVQLGSITLAPGGRETSRLVPRTLRQVSDKRDSRQPEGPRVVGRALVSVPAPGTSAPRVAPPAATSAMWIPRQRVALSHEPAVTAAATAHAVTDGYRRLQRTLTQHDERYLVHTVVWQSGARHVLPPVDFAAPGRVLSRPVVTNQPTPSERDVVAAQSPAAALRYWSDVGATVARSEVPDVARLTDHVLHTLDERLVAARERLSHGPRS